MPPSGFVTVETKTLAAVAKSLLTRFAGEVKSGVHTSYEVGIENELDTIATYMSGASHVEHGVLAFVEGLYRALKEGCTLTEIEVELNALVDKQYKLPK